MKKKMPKSRLLRRRLLSVLLLCIIAIMMIFYLVFNLVYKRSTNIVVEHTSKIASNTVDTTAHGFFQIKLGSLQSSIESFGDSVCTVIGSLQDIPDLDQNLVLETHLMEYFDISPSNWEIEGIIGFTFSNGEFHSIPSDPEGDRIIQETIEEFNNDYEQHSDFYGEEYSFQKHVGQYTELSSGTYSLKGSGYICAWDHLINHNVLYDDICYGVIMFNQNHYTELINNIAAEQTKSLLDEMNTLFQRYVYVIIAVIAGVMVLFIIISVILSKKLSDPIVSEHDMLVKVNEMKTTFLSDASHELKTPLATMSGYAQNAQMELAYNFDKEPIMEKLQRISSEANRMALMVTQILDATRIEEGRMILEPSPCDLDSLVRKTVETYFAVLNKNNNRLAIRIPIELPKINADSSRLQRVFVNLISNALKHTKNGTILIKAEEEGKFIKVTVKDTGSGISSEDMPHIWERYYKGKHSETGTGLGLYICKFIIESHGGKIWAESEYGNGTSFMFTLPVR
ncbi:MAG: HAMP domain-containing histidine kinase [Ruminococcus sp.]|uniref:sensor histidine kinase n=1 Tax=Ruminococcus sp. TaxID=41978 RepID=UPI0025F20190|nr:HAMP domain-containing sensor histidine kinase [Ruminococcus sp.]MCR5601117.1 HAMP domain-containing histidine kinase [Ruminococcus sp.]